MRRHSHMQVTAQVCLCMSGEDALQTNSSFCKIHPHMHIHTHIHTYVRMCVYVCVFVCVCMYVCIYIYTHTHISTHTHTHAHSYVHTYSHVMHAPIHAGIACNAAGTLVYVSETLCNRIIRFAKRSNGIFYSSVFKTFKGGFGPSSLLCADSGNLFVVR